MSVIRLKITGRLYLLGCPLGGFHSSIRWGSGRGAVVQQWGRGGLSEMSWAWGGKDLCQQHPVHCAISKQPSYIDPLDWCSCLFTHLCWNSFAAWNQLCGLLEQQDSAAKPWLLPALNKLLRKTGQLTLAVSWSDVSFLSTDLESGVGAAVLYWGVRAGR